MKGSREDFWIKLNGNSMMPLLSDQDDVLIRPIGQDISPGDIILFQDSSSKELTLHRLIEKPFRTKGDFSLCSEINTIESCLGTAIAYRRNNSYRLLPSSNSFFAKTFTKACKLRLKGCFLRKLARVILVILTMLFEIYSEKTKSSHSEGPK